MHKVQLALERCGALGHEDENQSYIAANLASERKIAALTLLAASCTMNCSGQFWAAGG